ncbi:FAD-binding oxidoreductase [Candidatus Microgenomates bacterium]|nr:FAD-binding oxidoreductase [Candidatus Microgenomates bacterium]
MQRWVRDLKKQVVGEVRSGLRYRRFYAHDASMFEVRPRAIVSPRDEGDLERLVQWARTQKTRQPTLSLTARAGGTDMSGGAINDSVIVDFRHFQQPPVVSERTVRVEPGVFYRDLEKLLQPRGLQMPAYPASKEICKIGGMVANNAGGEKSLSYGKTDRYVKALRVVLRDGQTYIIKPLNHTELKRKLQQRNLEGQLYRQTYQLLEANYDLLQQARPQVSKDSTGYHLWDVWDKHTFDLTKLFVGSQGTLGLISEVTFQLVPIKQHSGLLVAFLPQLDQLGEIINTVLATNPTSFESFDEHTLKFALRFFPYFRKSLGWPKFLHLLWQLLPDVKLLAKGLPKLIVMVEYADDNPIALQQQIARLKLRLEPFDLSLEEAASEQRSRKYWTLRRESFNLLRHNVKRRHAAPFIDDFIVPPARLPEFLPQLQSILERYKLMYTIAGHLGDGNFHIIPLMRLQDKLERLKLEPILKEVNQLVLRYGGSLSAEHNDGLIRGPWLQQMYGPAVADLFAQIKQIFDPGGLFNPHKKTQANWQWSLAHIRKRWQ